MVPYDQMDFVTGRSYPPTDEEINRENEVEQMDTRPWKELTAKGKVIKVGNKVKRAVF